jgi:hypothetical protein
MDHGIESSGRAPRRRGRVMACAGSLLALALLGGCGSTPGGSADNMAPVQVETPRDPVVAFAVRATPGQSGTVQTAEGTQTVRLSRAYFAASGRECREVVVGAGLQERSRLVCLDRGRWVDARSLLRGGSATQ